jgi:hypothetical protein
VRNATKFRGLEGAGEGVERRAGGHHVVDDRHVPAAHVACHGERIGDIAAARVEVELRLRQRVRGAHGEHRVGFDAEPPCERPRDRPRLVVAAPGQALLRQRHRCHDIGQRQIAVLEGGVQKAGERVGRCEARAELEVERERVERRAIVGKRERRIEMWRIGDARCALPIQLASSRASCVSRGGARKPKRWQRQRTSQAPRARLVPVGFVASPTQCSLRQIAT